MRLTAFNGSPRARASNTRFFLDAIVEGFQSVEGSLAEVHYIAGENDLPGLAKKVSESECILLAFPLYVDSMPSIVKAFIEELEPWKGRLSTVHFCFLVQSGFPEAVHSRAVERYLKRLTQLLGGVYLGTIIKGGANSVRYMTGGKREKSLEPFRRLGEELARNGDLDGETVLRLARPERFSPFVLGVLNLLDRTGILGLMWRKTFRENGSYERRFDRPYE